MNQENPPNVRTGGYQTLIVRMFDIFFSMISLILSAPLFPVIAVLIKLDSKGPVFFLTERVGKDMKRFPMYKFRTMMESSVRIDQSICPQYDPRVTTFGRILRRTKLNELPQLLNVLKGEMSFVGPRPEAPDLAEMYPDKAKKVFLAKPGLVGPAVISSLRGTIRGRNEEELFPPGVDPKQYYLQHIVPEKVKFDLSYLSRQTVDGYFKIIFLAVKETIFGAISARQADRSKRQIYLFITDLALGQISYAFGWLLYMRTVGAGPSLRSFLSGLLLVVVARPFFHYALGLHNLVVELITPHDIFRLLRGVGLGSLLMLALNALLGLSAYPLMVAAVDFCFLSVMLTGVRLFLIIHFRFKGRIVAADRRPRALIFGANGNGLKALYSLGGSKNGPYKVVGFIDDAEEKYAKKINGVKVLGNRHHIRALSVLHNVREVILAPDSEMRDEIDEIVAHCVQAGIRSRMFSPEMDDETPRSSSYPLRPIHLSDVLPLVPVQMDETALRSLLSDKTVLMVGSGGKLGSTICRNIFLSGCRKVVIVDRFESPLGEVLTELRSDLPGFQIVPAVLDCRDIGALNNVFVQHRPHIVIHAGMRKFLTLGNIDNEEVARSNYLRTFNLARVAGSHGCEYFLVISSIKAACRGNFISESLRVAEISLNAFFGRTETRLIVARVGNIIENRGGIVSWLNDQILEQRYLRLPVETAKTFLLSKKAATRSILQALVTGSSVSPGGSLLTSEPGALLGLAEVARKIANLYGLRLGTDITLRFGEIANGLMDDEPATAMTGRHTANDTPDGLPGSGRGFGMIENMIYGDIGHMSSQDWYQETEEIVSQFDYPQISPNKRVISH
jgi:FlaA1/EpsC-like NDP-sugar epimerase/lipopolysaccharide/colanic/teichoic acid biosynthesis glycosyltransferase